jgi:hypothetical protein
MGIRKNNQKSLRIRGFVIGTIIEYSSWNQYGEKIKEKSV